jgi:hypothetical protein
MMLCQEPWCFTPEQIGRLTDWQILELYAKPASERAERMSSPTGPKPLGTRREPDAEPGTPEHRAQVVGGMVRTMGWKPERAAAEYDRQLALWKAQKGS